MAKSAWPTVAEVLSYLESQGVTLPPGASLQDEIDAAVEQVETLTGWRPFLSTEDSASDTFYDPPKETAGGFILDLQGGYTSVVAVAINCTDSDQTGTVLDLNTDYVLLPYDAADKERPYTQISLLTFWSLEPRSIRVNGVRGYWTTIPVDLWLAVRNAAGMAVRLASEGGFVKREKQGPVEMEFQDGAGAVDSARTALLNAARRYQRV